MRGMGMAQGKKGKMVKSYKSAGANVKESKLNKKDMKRGGKARKGKGY